MTEKSKPAEKVEQVRPVEYVQFLDNPGIREITEADWNGAGVEGRPKTRWDVHNNWTVKRADLGLNDEQFARIILADRGFRVYWEAPEETSA